MDHQANALAPGLLMLDPSAAMGGSDLLPDFLGDWDVPFEAGGGRNEACFAWSDDSLAGVDQLTRAYTDTSPSNSSQQEFPAWKLRSSCSSHSVLRATSTSLGGASTASCLDVLETKVIPAEQATLSQKKCKAPKKPLKRSRSASEREARMKARNRAAQKAFRDRQKEKAVERETAMKLMQAELELLKEENVNLHTRAQAAELLLQQYLRG